MTASVNDKFRKASSSTRPVVTTLALPKANGATSAELQVATGWNTTTGVDVMMYRRQLNTTTGLYEVQSGTVTTWVAELSGTTLSNMELAAGTEPASGYAADGNTVVQCGPTARWSDDLIDALLEVFNQDATLKSGPVQDALGIGAGASGGWDILNAGTAPTVATGYNKGNKEFALTFAGVDLTSTLSAGMRLKFDRSTTAPTQCMSFTAASSQYASKSSPSGISFTGAFTCEAWVYLNSYTGSNMFIIGREDVSGASGGFSMYLNSSGQVKVEYGTTTSFTNFLSYQSIPLKRWVHIAGIVTSVSSKTGAIYINGVSVPVSSPNTAATTLTQSTADLRVGAFPGTASGFFDGQISEARIWSAARTATQIQDNMAISLAGSETNLVALFQGNGNFNDKTSNGNNLTASGSAIATYSDNPYHTTEYGIVTKVAYATSNTTVTVFTGTDYMIPNMALTNPFSSFEKTPFGFPASRTTWRVSTLLRTSSATTSNTNYGSYLSGGYALSVPTGKWDVGWQSTLYNITTTAVRFNLSSTDLTGLSASAGASASPLGTSVRSSAAAEINTQARLQYPYDIASQTSFVMYTLGATTSAGIPGDVELSELFAECAYV